LPTTATANSFCAGYDRIPGRSDYSKNSIMYAAESVRILVPTMLIVMMTAIGLGVNFSELAAVARNWRLIVKAVLANYLCVPLITVGLLVWFQPADPMVTVGFLILAVCPGAPFGPACTKLAKGNVTASVGVMVLLAGSSAVVGPLLLWAFLPMLLAGGSVQLDATKIIVTLLVTQLAPLCLGLVLRQWLPGLAGRLLKPVNLLSAILSLATFGLVLVVNFSLLAEIRLRVYLGMVALLAASCVVGWLLGGPGSDNRKALMLTSSLRNVGVGLVIVTTGFSDTAAVTAVVVYGIVEIIGSLMLALSCRR
jgi:bile acid:Na+ symporter, BASS family